MTLISERLRSRFIRLLVEQDRGAEKLSINQADSILQDLELITNELGSSVSGSFNSSFWRSEVSNQSAPPKNGRLEWNDVAQISSTEIFISKNNNSGTDVAAFFGLLSPGDHFRIQLKTDSSVNQVFKLSSATDHSAYWTFGVTHISSNGGNIDNNKDILVTFITAGDLPDHATSHQNGGDDEINVAGLSGELADPQPVKTHGASHTSGTDDIQNATAGQKGLATSTQITKLNGIEDAATADAKANQATVNVGTDNNDFITPLTLTNKVGVEGFFLESQGLFGTGGGWADQDFLDNLPVLAFASNLTERAIYMFYGLVRVKFDAVDPQVGFTIYTTSAPTGGNNDVRWRLTCKYLAEGDATSIAASQTLLQTQTLSSIAANTRQTNLFFTLDRSLISNQDVIFLTLERLGGDAADNYGSDADVGQAGIILQTTSFNT